MKVVACVPIKLNNERLPGKNTRLLGGKPLIGYILETLLSVGEINEIYVYCSSSEIQQYLPKGVCFLQRSPELDLPSANFTEIFSSFSQAVPADVYVYAHATAPFVTKETIQRCINSLNSELYDSAFAGVPVKAFLWLDSKSLNFDPAQLPRTQDLPNIYKEASSIYVFRNDVFKESGRRIGNSPYIAEVSGKEAVDIDYPEDFELAEYYLGKGDRL